MIRSTKIEAINSKTGNPETLIIRRTDDNAEVFELLEKLDASEGVIGKVHYAPFELIKNGVVLNSRNYLSPEAKAAAAKAQAALERAEKVAEAGKAEKAAEVARIAAEKAGEVAKAAKAALG